MSSQFFKNKKILVTGGTGSFGHHIAEALLKYKPKEIRIFSRDEKKQDDMRREYENVRNLRFIIGDVRDLHSVSNAMRDIDIVFHAAALKQVPNCEYNVFETVKTNIIGAQNVVTASMEENVEKVVAISTDKAVEPVNVMGMSKAIQERIITSANLFKDGKRTIFCCVRYGNVLGSRGSVVPVFKEQINKGLPLTITDRQMTRFILTLDDAIDLVFYAAINSVGGEIFVANIPSHTVGDLVEVMFENCKVKNNKIKSIGIRCGEKLHETLISPTESLKTIKKRGYFIILPQIPALEIEKKYPNYRNTKMFRFSSDKAKRLNKAELKSLLKKEGWI